MPNIEKLIAQQSFTDEKHKCIVSLIFVGNWIESRQQQFFKKYGITMQQFNILRILRGQHPQSANIQLLRDRMLDRMSDVSRLVGRLQKHQLIERRLCEEDRRSVDINITEKGLDLLKQIDKHFDQLKEVADGLTEEEMKTLNSLLDKMLDNY